MTTNGASGADGVNGSTTINGDGSLKKKAPYPYNTEPEPGNPTVVPTEMLSKFHFAFLIRDPHYSIPSYYRCTIPPLDEVTGFYEFYPSEAGYDEVRRVFDYLRKVRLVGPRIATDGLDPEYANENANDINGVNGINRSSGGVEICVVDADELLEKPAEMIKAFCKSVGFEYSPDMLNWDDEEDHHIAKEAFEKWKGFHNDAIDSKGLTARGPVSLFSPIPFLFLIPTHIALLPKNQKHSTYSINQNTNHITHEIEISQIRTRLRRRVACEIRREGRQAHP